MVVLIANWLKKQWSKRPKRLKHWQTVCGVAECNKNADFAVWHNIVGNFDGQPVPATVVRMACTDHCQAIKADPTKFEIFDIDQIISLRTGQAA